MTFQVALIWICPSNASYCISVFYCSNYVNKNDVSSACYQCLRLWGWKDWCYIKTPARSVKAKDPEINLDIKKKILSNTIFSEAAVMENNSNLFPVSMWNAAYGKTIPWVLWHLFSFLTMFYLEVFKLEESSYSFWNAEWQSKLFVVVMLATISLENLVQQGLWVCNLILLRPLLMYGAQISIGRLEQKAVCKICYLTV